MSIIAHGTYIDDIVTVERDRVFHRVMKLPLRAVWDICRESDMVEFSQYSQTGRATSYVGDDLFRRNGGLVGKGFVLVSCSCGEEIAAIGNHDGTYYLYSGDTKAVLHWLASVVVVSGVSRESKLRTLAEDISLVSGHPLPWQHVDGEVILDTSFRV